VVVQRIRYQGSILLVRLVALLNEQAGVHVCWTPSYMRVDDMPHVTVGSNFVVTADGSDAAINTADTGVPRSLRIGSPWRSRRTLRRGTVAPA
jgi:hypothetical protein